MPRIYDNVNKPHPQAMPSDSVYLLPKIPGLYKTWTLDSGLDYGLDSGLIFPEILFVIVISSKVIVNNNKKARAGKIK